MTLLCLLVCLICLLPVQAAKTACRVPSVGQSDATTLTCYFSEDVSQTKKDFAVYRYSGNERPDPVVDCLWVDGKLNCYTKPGYTYDPVISNEATVQIPRLSANQTGRYTCQISGLQPEDFEFCELFISPETRTCELQSQESTEEHTLTCIFPENIAQSKNDFAVYHFDDLGRQVVVVDCFWHMDSLSCKTHPGYQSDNTVTDRFQVRISQTSEHRNGSYLCEMSGSSPIYVSICSFPQGGHVYQMATDVSRESSNAAAVVLGILLAIALAVLFCVIIYIKCKHPQVLQSITCPKLKKEKVERQVVRSGDREAAVGLMTNQERTGPASRVRSIFTNAVQRISSCSNAASTDIEMNAEQAGNISDEQLHRKGKLRSLAVETDRRDMVEAVTQVTEKELEVFDPKPRTVPQTSGVNTRPAEHPSDVTVEVEDTSDSTNKKKSKFSFGFGKSKNKEKESKKPPEKDKDTPGDSKHAGIHHSTKTKSTPDDQESFDHRHRDEFSRENVGHGQDRAFGRGYEGESSSRRQPSEEVKYPDKSQYPPEKAASASAAPKSRTPVSEETHMADSRKSKPREEYRPTEEEDVDIDIRRHSRPAENRPQSRGDKRDPAPVKSSVNAPSRYPGYPEDPGQRSGDVASIARDQVSNVTGAPQAPAGARALQTSGFQMPETGTEETSDKKTSKNKKSMKQESKESEGKDKSKGAFWSRSSSKKQKEGSAPTVLLSGPTSDDAEAVNIQVEEKKKKKSGLFSRSSSKKEAKAAAAAPLLGDKINENAEEASRTDPQQELIKDSDKKKDSKKKKEKEKTSRKGKAESQ
ncbi:uncharacterized protein LOC112568642 [Pomacea canaliculata]|uniref:uncharacterized protein LOC112568642 n=1 Tax=Pomacea canaliculata TaxID=400727 RepID=UPI000D72ED19|nr:uncharacterized protein LOC112568642 [Pomacea canaliculata]XP_025101827.1 uncharacterized protein LOC112568642 [Pomacea canaliculata]XP_025101828.1 uncharacterized protein LOC112568642 [Pomacea canaliculata]